MQTVTITNTYEQVLTEPSKVKGWGVCHVVKSVGKGGWISLAGVPAEQVDWAVQSLKEKGAKNVIPKRGSKLAVIKFQGNQVMDYLAHKFPPACKLPAA